MKSNVEEYASIKSDTPLIIKILHLLKINIKAI